MGKILKIGLVVAAVAINFVPGVGQAVSGAIWGTLTGGAIGAVSAAVLTASQWLVAGIGALGLATGLGMAAKAAGLGPKLPKVNRASMDRLRASIDPTTPRKLVFGRTAMATDVRYQAFTGSNKEYYWQIVCGASHRAEAIEELWLDDKLAWSASGGVSSTYAGYLQVTAIAEGSAANVQSIDAGWGPAAGTRLTGCAYLCIRYKVTGNSKKTESPFSSSIPSRMTIVGRGMRVYDPRRDSTAGGSGPMRADDQSTWAWAVGSDQIGRNPALQMLAWLLGWRINGKLAVGRGAPPARIDMASFIAAANLCDEAVALSAGGSEPRYRFDGIFDEGEDGGSVLTAMSASMHAVLRDNGGRLALTVLHNDLAAPVMTLSEADVIGPFNWEQTQPLEQHRNVVRGRYTDPSANALYQLVDYPEARIASPDGIDRILTLDLPGVQSASQAQRLAKQALQRIQHGGVFTATLNAKGWALLVGDPVEWDFAPLGWVGKPMRLVERTIRSDGVSDCVFAEENAAIYAWSAGDEKTPVTPAAPTNYDYSKHPFFGADKTEDQPIVQRLDPVTGRAEDARILPPVSALNLGYRFTGAISYSAAAGTPATATISVAAGQALIGSAPISYNAMAVGVSGTGGATATYYLYVDEGPDPASWGGSKTLVATTNGDDVYASDNRVWIGTVTLTFPSSGSDGGTGGSGGGGGIRPGGGGGNPIP